jgi:hypothetical protein
MPDPLRQLKKNFKGLSGFSETLTMLVGPLRRTLQRFPLPASHHLFEKSGRPLFAQLSGEETYQILGYREPLSFGTSPELFCNRLRYLDKELGHTITPKERKRFPILCQ